MICANYRNPIFLTDEDNLPGVWSHTLETNCDDPTPTTVFSGYGSETNILTPVANSVRFIWEDDCSEWNAQVNKASVHIGKHFEQEGFTEEQIKGIISRFMDWVTFEESGL